MDVKKMQSDSSSDAVKRAGEFASFVTYVEERVLEKMSKEYRPQFVSDIRSEIKEQVRLGGEVEKLINNFVTLKFNAFVMGLRNIALFAAGILTLLGVASYSQLSSFFTNQIKQAAVSEATKSIRGEIDAELVKTTNLAHAKSEEIRNIVDQVNRQMASLQAQIENAEKRNALLIESAIDRVETKITEAQADLMKEQMIRKFEVQEATNQIKLDAQEEIDSSLKRFNSEMESNIDKFKAVVDKDLNENLGKQIEAQQEAIGFINTATNQAIARVQEEASRMQTLPQGPISSLSGTVKLPDKDSESAEDGSSIEAELAAMNIIIDRDPIRAFEEATVMARQQKWGAARTLLEPLLVNPSYFDEEQFAQALNILTGEPNNSYGNWQNAVEAVVSGARSGSRLLFDKADTILRSLTVERIKPSDLAAVARAIATNDPSSLRDAMEQLDVDSFTSRGLANLLQLYKIGYQAGIINLSDDIKNIELALLTKLLGEDKVLSEAQYFLAALYVSALEIKPIFNIDGLASFAENTSSALFAGDGSNNDPYGLRDRLRAFQYP